MKQNLQHLRRLLFTLIVVAFTASILPAQVAVNTDGTSPDGSAMLDVKSSDKGLLIPRLTTAARNTLAATAVAGLMVFDTDLNKFFFFNGLTWEEGSTGSLWSRSGSYTNLTNTSDFVGIGTTTPTRRLEVTGNWRTARLNSTTNAAYLEFTGTNATDWAIGTAVGSMRMQSSTDGFATSTDRYFFGTNYFHPYSNNARSLGISAYRWSNLYSVAGNFSGAVATGALTTTGNATISGTATIGTTSPLGQLHVHDAVNQNTIAYLTSKSTNDSTTLFFSEGTSATLGMYWMYDGFYDEMELWGRSSGTEWGPHLLVKRTSGNIAMGGTFATGYKLSVAGKIICEELRVDLVAGWPDYVFGKEYKLMSLKELDAFIETNGHLPNIPAAEDIDESGLDVGEMQRLMMEKIEELSLYVIQQQKEIEELKKQINKNRK